MHANLRKLIGALFALMVLTTGAAAAATFDTETVTTPSTSDISGASTTVLLDPGNSSEALYVETDGAASSNLTLEISPAEAGVDTVMYANATPDTVNATNGHYAWNVSHDELTDLARDEMGGTYNVTVVNDTGAEILNTEVVFETTRTGDEDAVMWVSDDSGSDGAAMTNLVADDLEITSESKGFWYFAEDFNVSTWSGYTQVNGSSSDVTIHMKNTSTSEAYGNATEDVEDGEWITSSTVWINGIPHKVYMNEAPEDVEDGATVVTFNNDTETLNVDLGEEYKNTRTVSIRSTGGDGYAFGELWSNFGAVDALGSIEAPW